MRTQGTPPSGADLLRILVELLADQEGVKIEYIIETTEKEEKEKSA